MAWSLVTVRRDAGRRARGPARDLGRAHRGRVPRPGLQGHDREQRHRRGQGAPAGRRRPGRARLLRRPLLLAWLQDFWGGTTDYPAIVDEVTAGLFRELDFRKEAENAARFWDVHFPKASYLRVPRAGFSRDAAPAKWSVTPRVHLAEWVDGQPLGALTPERQRAMVEKGLDVCFLQLFGTNFVHADPHYGNMLYDPDDRLVLLDFGLVTRLTPAQGEAMANAVSSIVSEDWPNSWRPSARSASCRRRRTSGSTRRRARRRPACCRASGGRAPRRSSRRPSSTRSRGVAGHGGLLHGDHDAAHGARADLPVHPAALAFICGARGDHAGRLRGRHGPAALGISGGGAARRAARAVAADAAGRGAPAGRAANQRQRPRRRPAEEARVVGGRRRRRAGRRGRRQGAPARGRRRPGAAARRLRRRRAAGARARAPRAVAAATKPLTPELRETLRGAFRRAPKPPPVLPAGGDLWAATRPSSRPRRSRRSRRRPPGAGGASRGCSCSGTFASSCGRRARSRTRSSWRRPRRSSGCGRPFRGFGFGGGDGDGAWRALPNRQL